MSITAVDATYVGVGPSGTLQVLADGGIPGSVGQLLYAYCTFVGDGSTVDAVCNLVPGTSGAGVLSFTPAFGIAGIFPSAATQDTAATAVRIKTITTAAITFTFSVAPVSSDKIKVCFMLSPA